MYQISTKRIKNNHALCTVNYKTTDPNVVYVPVGTNNTYIQSDLGLKIFLKNRPLKYITNIFPINRNATSNIINFELYEGMKTSSSVIYVISNNVFDIVMGQYLTTATNVAMIDLGTKQIKTEYEDHLFGATNLNLPIHFNGQTYNKSANMYITDALQVFTLNTKYETIIYPYSTTRTNGIYTIFEIQNKEYFEFDYQLEPTTFPQSTHRMYRPLFLFSGDDGLTWYKYNPATSSFANVAPTGAYFTLNEFRSQANTFNEYSQIDYASFLSQFGDSATNITVLSPCYCYSKIISHNFWKDKADIQDFLWAHSKSNKWTFVSGVV